MLRMLEMGRFIGERARGCFILASMHTGKQGCSVFWFLCVGIIQNSVWYARDPHP